MAGARTRPLNLSGYIQARLAESQHISEAGAAQGAGWRGLLGGVGMGLSNINTRNERLRQEGRSDARYQQERQDRLDERAYQHTQDRLQNKRADLGVALAYRREAEAEEARKAKVATLAGSVDKTVGLLARAKAALATGMPMDPEVLTGIRQLAPEIMANGGPAAIKQAADQQTEDDIDGLIDTTGKYQILERMLMTAATKEKDPARHGAIADALMQLHGHIERNRARIALHDRNTKRAEQAVAEEQRRIAYEASPAGQRAQAAAKRAEEDQAAQHDPNAPFLKAEAEAANTVWDPYLHGGAPRPDKQTLLLEAVKKQGKTWGEYQAWKRTQGDWTSPKTWGGFPGEAATAPAAPAPPPSAPSAPPAQGGGDAAARAQAELDALPPEQQTPEAAQAILKKYGLR